MAYIRKVKTASGATAVQIVRKEKGQIVKINHIGSAHTPEELAVLVAIARKILHENQLELFPEKSASDHLGLKRSYSGLLWNLLRDAYKKIGFDQLNDERRSIVHSKNCRTHLKIRQFTSISRFRI
jgi:hypothetical protein